MKLFTIFAAIALSIFVISCTKDVGQNPDLLPKAPEGCDSITFTNHIKPIIDAKCVTCHFTGAQSPDLSTYAIIKSQVDAGRITERVINQAPSPMPPLGNPTPTDVELNSIKCWLDAGAPNN